VDAVGVFDAAAHDRHLVDFLEDLTAELADRAGAAKADHRAAIDERVGEAGREVDRRRARGRHADAGLLGQPAIGLRRERRRLLVADVDHPDAFLDTFRLGQQHRAAHDVEDVFDAFGLEAFRQDFRTGQFRHLRSPPRGSAVLFFRHPRACPGDPRGWPEHVRP
jgi:hypothetical protein